MTVLSVGDVRLAGVFSSLPPRSVDNLEALPPVCGARTADIVKATGIRHRRLATPGMTGLDYSIHAAERLLAAGGFALSDFGAIVNVSFTGAERMPCGACRAQARLGLPNDIVALDVNLACSGYPYGLYLAATLAKATGRRTLLLDGDVQSSFLAGDDAATNPVLADGGSASVIESEKGAEPWRFAFASHGAEGNALRLPASGTIAMDGYRVFRFAAVEVTAFLREFLAAVELAPTEVGAFVPHQANVFMVRELARSLAIPADRTWISADAIGNLSSASVPVTISRASAGRGTIRNLLLCGFGGGLSIGAAHLALGDRCILGSVDHER